MSTLLTLCFTLLGFAAPTVQAGTCLWILAALVYACGKLAAIAEALGELVRGQRELATANKKPTRAG